MVFIINLFYHKLELKFFIQNHLLFYNIFPQVDI